MPFDPIELREFTGGINTKVRGNKIADNEMQSILSMDFVANSMKRALGYTQFGTEANSGVVGKTLYKHTVLAGVEVLVKTIGTLIKYYDTVDDTWYILTDSTFTTGLRWTFTSFNGYLYGDNGTDGWVFWDGGGRSTLDGAISAGATTIDLATGEGSRFGSTGDGMIQGDSFSWTGRTGDQLTGVSGLASAHADGSTVITALDSSTYSGLSKANQIVFFQNRNFMIDATTPTTIRHSKLADNTNPETDIVNFTVAGSGTGDAGFGIAPHEITAIFPFITDKGTSILVAFCKDGTAYEFNVVDGSSTTTNAFIPIRTGAGYPPAKQLVAQAENDLVYIDQYGHIRTLFVGDVNNPIQSKTISQKIEPSLEATNFSADGNIAYHKRKLYATGKSSQAVLNDITFYHDSNYDAWGAYGHWDVNDVAEYNGDLYGLSTINGNVWKLNDGTDANGGTFRSEIVMKDFDFGAPLQYKTALKMRLNGYITNNATVYLDIFFNDSSSFTTWEISGDNTDILDSEANVAVGSVVFGEGVVGGGRPLGANTKQFYAECMMNDLNPFFKMYLRIRIDDQNVDFELNDLDIYVQAESEELWQNIRTLKVS